MKRSLIAYNLIEAPITITIPDSIPVKRIPILSRIIPAKMRKNANTLRKYSELQNVPYVSADHPLVVSNSVESGESTSTNMYAKNIMRATSINAAQRAIKLSFSSFFD